MNSHAKDSDPEWFKAMPEEGVAISEDADDFDISDHGYNEAEQPKTQVEFLTGSAGTGKTYEINQRLAADPNYALVAATTGIAAVNLGENVTTVNAALGYFDTESLIENYIKGWTARRLRKIRDMGYKNLVVDEVSMMPAEQLDTIVRACDDLDGALGLVVTGDFCQLPPVNARWAFEADAWPRFAANTTTLTKCWRQADGPFLAALGAFRRGDGRGGVAALDQCDVEYCDNNDLDFTGTTIMAKNDEVDRFNWAAHARLPGKMTVAKSRRWGKQKGEWKLIPASLELKLGAYVMILANCKANAMTNELLYANGDCGVVVGYHPGDQLYRVELRRNGTTVTVGPITRRNEQKERPTEEIAAAATSGATAPYYDKERKRWVTGEVTYSPLRLAYASTVHKVQGVTLDAVQINLSSSFFGQPAMAYVALSRCRTAEGLRLIGNRDLLARRVCVDPRVLPYL